MKATFLKGVVLGSVVSGVTLITSVALAGTGVGGVFNLGKTNTVNATTTLTGSTNGKQLQVTNTNTGTKAAGIGIKVAPGTPPLVVNSTTKVNSLNADQLDGLDSTNFQQRVTGACANGTAIATVAASGTVNCTSSAVLPIATNPADGTGIGVSLPPSNLTLATVCHVGTTASDVAFQDRGPNTATLNWMFSQGGTTSTVNASGSTIGAGSEQDFVLGGNRLEGQFIYTEPGFVITVNLHVFDAGAAGCEFRGTAELAAIP